MPDFIAVGKEMINVDRIQYVTVWYGEKQSPLCSVHFAGGDKLDFDGNDAKELIAKVRSKVIE